MSVERILKRQAEWQRARKDLPWSKKVRMIEAVRESLEKFSRLRKRTRP